MIAVTGAAGFIGSNLAHRLAAGGHPLLLVDRGFGPPAAANLAGLDRHRHVGHDAFLADLAAAAVAPEAVFHLGACSSTTETDWAYLQSNNVDYTRRLWDWCAAHGKPFIYASSAATYGDGAKGFDDRIPPTELQPLNLYGKSKNDFDAWALAEAAAGRPTPPRWAGLKFFNVYGPREAHKGRMASMAYHTHRQVTQTGLVRLFKSTHPAYPDGGQERDFVHVDDCVSHMLWLWRRPHPGGIYNSGTGVARTFLDLARAVFAALGRDPAVTFVDMPADLAGQYQNHTRAVMDKLYDTGYPHPPTDLEAGVAAYVRWLSAAGQTTGAA